ncbi:MAG: serine hydrolase, partial [Myxococcota bacterium]
QRNWLCPRLLKRSVAFQYLRERTTLSAAFRHYIKDLRACGLLKQYDREHLVVENQRSCRLVSMHSEQRTSAASLIKPFVMLAIYHKAKAEGVPAHRFSRTKQRLIENMMRISSNRATNQLIRNMGEGSLELGLQRINRLIRRFGITQTRLVEAIPRSGRTYKNQTSAADLSRFFSLVYQKTLVSRAYSRKMLRVMLSSRDNRGRTAYLRRRFHVRAATKTGYTKKTNGVAGLWLSTPGLRHRAYNFVAILSRPLHRGNEWEWRKITTPILQRLSEMTYLYQQKHRRTPQETKISAYSRTSKHERCAL